MGVRAVNSPTLAVRLSFSYLWLLGPFRAGRTPFKLHFLHLERQKRVRKLLQKLK